MRGSLKKPTNENSLFYINSFVYNIEKSKDELINNFKCFYSPSQEAVCIIIETEVKYANLSREIMMNLMEFARKVEAKNLLLMLDKKNTEYVKILQGVMTVGFTNDKKIKTSTINEKDYKLLKMEMKAETNIEEITI